MCYVIQSFGRSSEPLLKTVDSAFILTMHDSQRTKSAGGKDLLTLCGQTYLQINHGWKRCTKPDHVASTATDLIDAYRHLFTTVEHLDQPILILEDDAVIFRREREHYEKVDEFVRSKQFDVYSLGSVGALHPFQLALHRRYIGFSGFSQAIIWSAEGRRNMLRMMDSLDARRTIHMDMHLISKLNLRYTYHKPLVVQLFPDTENQRAWCYRCKNEWWEVMVTASWVKVLNAMGLSERPNGWSTLYCVNRHCLRVLIALLTILLVTRRAR